MSCVGARFSPTVLRAGSSNPGRLASGPHPAAVYMGQDTWGEVGESLREGKAIAFRSQGSTISKNMNFVPEARSPLSLSCCLPALDVRRDLSVVLAPPWARLRCFHRSGRKETPHWQCFTQEESPLCPQQCPRGVCVPEPWACSCHLC